jgi:hypothetical protein
VGIIQTIPTGIKDVITAPLYCIFQLNISGRGTGCHCWLVQQCREDVGASCLPFRLTIGLMMFQSRLPIIVRQKEPPVKAGKCQHMNVAWIVKMPHSFLMNKTFLHADYLAPKSTAGRASSGTLAQ